MRKTIKKIIKIILRPYLFCLLKLINDYRITKRLERRNIRLAKTMITNLLDKNEKIQIELGSQKFREGWIIVDIGLGADLRLDLTNDLPFPDNTVTSIYSSHLLEHFSYTDMINLLKEIYRILKPEGTFSVAVPDASIFIQAYCTKDNSNIWNLITTSSFNYNSRIDYVNYIAYMNGEHKMMFDQENLTLILKNTGFSKVSKRNFDIQQDLEVRNRESIYAFAVK